MTRLTALTIGHRNDIEVTYAGPQGGKYLGIIMLGETDRYRPLLTTDYIYDSREAAEGEMKKIVTRLRDDYNNLDSPIWN